MAILKNGILGGISGKVSGVVGSNWRGLDVIRGYAKPSNPNTAAQQTQRSKFSVTVAFAKNILSSVINVYWLGKNAFMSPYNSFMKVNISLSDAINGITSSNKITSGSLEGASIISANYSGSEITPTWLPNCYGNGLATDSALIVVYDRENDVAWVSDAVVERADEELAINIGTGRTATELVVFLAFYRGSDDTLIVSSSQGAYGAAA